MAGKRQHYIPRLLQRGFLDLSSEGAQQTWLHRRGVIPRRVSIRHIGVEDWFYSRKSQNFSPTLDDVISDIEQDLAPSLRNFRSSTPGSSCDPHEAAYAVVHLAFRTAHLRQIMSTSMSQLFSEAESLFLDPTRLSEMIGLTGRAPASPVTKAIRESASELEHLGIPATFSERLIAYEIREVGAKLVEQAVATLDPIFPNLFDSLADRIREAHNSIVATSPESNGWVSALTEFKWTIESGEDLILPDTVALACEKDGQLLPLLFTSAKDVEAVVMPISTDRMLVARKSDRTLIDVNHFNKEAAANSDSFFIAAKPITGNELIDLIGTAPANIIEKAISQAVRETERPQSEPDLLHPASHDRRNFSFNVSAIDFGDAEITRELAEIIESVVNILSRELPLHDLDGITIASDYEGALATLDRGDTDLPPIVRDKIDFGFGVGIPVTVSRAKVRKQHLVIAVELAEMWLSSNSEERAYGLATLTRLLAGIAHRTLYANAYDTSITLDSLSEPLHRIVSNVPITYWSARKTAFLTSDRQYDLSEFVIKGLDSAAEVICDALRLKPDEGNFDHTLVRVLECISPVVCHAAEWLGHRDGISETEEFMDNSLPERLKEHGLDGWLELFGRDLDACYEPDNTFNLEVVGRLSSHVERILWSLGIFCWPEGNSFRYVIADQAFTPPKFWA